MLKKNLIMGIDIDGVIRNFEAALRKAYKEAYPDHKINEVSETWGLHNDFPIGEEIYKFCWETHAEECLFWAHPYDNAIDILRSISRIEDREVYLITTQPTHQAKRYTLEWICDYLIQDIDGVIMISGGGEINKGSLNGLNVLADDYIGNLEKLPKDVIPLCVKRPWNKEWKGPRYDFEQIPDVITKIQKHTQ